MRPEMKIKARPGAGTFVTFSFYLEKNSGVIPSNSHFKTIALVAGLRLGWSGVLGGKCKNRDRLEENTLVQVRDDNSLN